MKPSFVPAVILQVILVSFFACAVQGNSTNEVEVPSYTCRLWQSDDGLPQDDVQAISQTSDGYLCVGTPQALARFDGVRFTIVQSVSFPEIKNHARTLLSAGHNDDFWSVTQDGKLRRSSGGKFSELRLPPPLSGSTLNAILPDRDGSLWIGTDVDGLVHFKDGRFTRFTTANSLAHRSVRSICQDKDGVIWVATGAGVNRISGATITTLTTRDGLPHNSIRAICADHLGNLWIASNFGLTRWKDGAGTHFTKQDGLSDNLISVIFEDHSGTIWVGTLDGLNRLANGKWITETRDDGNSYDRVNCILEDREKNLWIGSKDGLSRLRPRAITPLTRKDGLTHNSVTFVFEDHATNLWVGFWGGGVNLLQNGTVTAMTTRNGLSSDLVLTMHETRAGDLWFGMDYDGGITVLRSEPVGQAARLSGLGESLRPAKNQGQDIDPRPPGQASRLSYNGHFIHYGGRNGVKDQGFKVFQEDTESNLWIGTRTALLLYKEGKFRRFTTQHGLPSNTIEAIHQDHAGHLWFGTAGGLALWQDGKFKAFTTKTGLSHNSISAIYEDRDGTLWLGTRGGGLNRVVLSVEKVIEDSPRFGEHMAVVLHCVAFTTADGLTDDHILGIVEDDLGFLWMSSPHGIFRVKKRDLIEHKKRSPLSCLSFGKPDGMVSTECKGTDKTAACKGKDGKLRFATAKGVAVIDPRAVSINQLPPQIVIEEIIADKQPLDWSSWQPSASATGEASQSPSVPQTLFLKPGRGELEFHYTSLSLAAPEKNRFKYRLEGMDTDWVDVGSRRVVYYNNLAPGRYRFHVIGCNNNGIWNETGASVTFVLQPHIWQTNWFAGLLGFVAIAFVAGTARYTTWKKVQRRLARLEQERAVENERARIARDMHDDLGARLTEILVLSSLTKTNKASAVEVETHATKISQAAQAVIDNLHAIVWAVNPKNDSLDKLVLYVCDHAPSFLKLNAIRCRLDLPTEPFDCPLSSEVRHNLFLVIKEALNNIAKHSRASEVWLHFRVEQRTFVIDIEDNGSGFSESPGAGNGLLNMEKRMQDIGGTFNLSTEPGKGTRIHLQIPVSAAKPLR